jgi:hypothetical protein
LVVALRLLRLRLVVLGLLGLVRSSLLSVMALVGLLELLESISDKAPCAFTFTATSRILGVVLAIGQRVLAVGHDRCYFFVVRVRYRELGVKESADAAKQV